MKVLLLLFGYFFLISSCFASSFKDYLRVHTEFRKKVCSKGTNRTYFNLLSKTQKTGNYVPINQDKLNKFVVEKNLILLRNKKNWIEKNRKKVNKKYLSQNRIRLSKLKETLGQINLLKRNHWLEKDVKKQKIIGIESLNKFTNFKKELKSFLDGLFVLHTFSYPVDHLLMRRDYDALKIRKDPVGKNLAQDIFFKRKIIEDGAPHPRWRGSDKSIRTLINTISVSLSKKRKEQFISENLRYDLDWLLDRIERYLNFDSGIINRKLQRWENKVTAQISFYNELLSGSVTVNGTSVSVSKFVKENVDSKSALEDFIYEKQAETYDFWSKQPQELRRLFVSETIILNEVGGTPDPGDMDKKEVLKVVHKRSKLKFYSSIGSDEELAQKLRERKIETDNFKWLNTLFKKGEFSFTYYFIPGVRHIFCPDMSQRARGIRNKALEIANELKGKNYNQPEVPVRYFSRQSMLGRIDMSKLWSNFSALPEKPGPRLKKEAINEVASEEPLYLYSFFSFKKTKYEVFKRKDLFYVENTKSGEMFEYRNPNYFKYFVEN